MDARPLARWAGATALVVAPLTLTIGTFVPGYGEDDPVPQQLADLASHPGTMSATNLLLLLPELLIVPAMLFVAMLARRGAPRLSVIGGGISLLASWPG